MYHDDIILFISSCFWKHLDDDFQIIAVESEGP